MNKADEQIFPTVEITWNASTVAVRTSMLLLCIRIFAIPTFRHVCWSVIGLNATIFLSVVLGNLLICRPIIYSFVKTIPNGKCGNLISFELYAAIMSLITDLLVVLLPLPVLWRLHMSSRKKVQLTFVFGMGAV